MRHSWSILYLMVVDAENATTSYTDYLRLGLRCPYALCRTRVFFVADCQRKPHERKLKSGEIVKVEGSNPKAHFNCFDVEECAGFCQRKDGESLTHEEIRKLNSQGRNQRWKHIGAHFLAMYQRSQSGAARMGIFLTDELMIEHLKTLGMSETVIRMSVQDASVYFRTHPDEIKKICRKFIRELAAIPPETLKTITTKWEEQGVSEHFCTLDRWLVDLEIDLHTTLVEEAVDFLAQNRSQDLLQSILLRGLGSRAVMLDAEGVLVQQMLLPTFFVSIIEAVAGGLCTTRWADNWAEAMAQP